MALMISVSGIRGIFGSHLTPQNLVTFTSAYGTWLNGGTVVVGRDSRVTGQICEDIVCATLQSVGCNVIKIGIAPTPTVAMSVLQHSADGGIILTASHNPEQWNALKLLNSKSEFLDADQGKEVLDIADKCEFEYKLFDKIGTVQNDSDAIQNHIQAVLNLPYIDSDLIKSKKFKVAVDAVNGGGSVALPALLEALGVQTECIYCEPTGIFPHNPEPLPENLTEICDFVKEKSCDLGVVTDPDGDRLALVDENGRLFGEEYTQVAAFDLLLSKNPGDTATNLSSSRAADDITNKYGHTCHRSAVGEINVVKVMQEKGAVIGGEGNGGVINADLHPGRDALVGTAMILQLLAERDIKASEYRDSLPDYEMSKQKIELSNLGMDADELLKKVTEVYADQNPNTVDGVKLDFDEGWVHFRKSNTEPIIRVYSEAKTKEAANQLADKILSVIK
ncbi:phosphoglucosamine mutase [Rhodohalobacter barkolensis]|uniref:Phosphoglucosamine mutase n=1 Tax=Rhodohalobacter barkolensis TaxID=2053187 RepID=A0A2N0VJ61_9BACT|nr:phosphoglucosamine mutase [Rhodohalobacter barkolensis]PKD44230.1 phosphoglucosamine mutase [Rhodohalobacter barkolensis]